MEPLRHDVSDAIRIQLSRADLNGILRSRSNELTGKFQCNWMLVEPDTLPDNGRRSELHRSISNTTALSSQFSRCESRWIRRGCRAQIVKDGQSLFTCLLVVLFVTKDLDSRSGSASFSGYRYKVDPLVVILALGPQACLPSRLKRFL